MTAVATVNQDREWNWCCGQKSDIKSDNRSDSWKYSKSDIKCRSSETDSLSKIIVTMKILWQKEWWGRSELWTRALNLTDLNQVLEIYYSVAVKVRGTNAEPACPYMLGFNFKWLCFLDPGPMHQHNKFRWHIYTSMIVSLTWTLKCAAKQRRRKNFLHPYYKLSQATKWYK